MPNRALVHYFEFWALRLNGLLPKYDTCSKCGLCVKDVGFFAWFEMGQVRCSSCSGGRGLHVHTAAAKSLYKIFQLSPEEYSRLPLGDEVADELERLALGYFSLTWKKSLSPIRSFGIC